MSAGERVIRGWEWLAVFVLAAVSVAQGWPLGCLGVVMLATLLLTVTDRVR